MRVFLKDNRWVLLVYVLLVCTALPFLLLYDKVSIHTKMNGMVGNKLMDSFFFYVTYFGDGAMAGFILLAVLLSNIRNGLYASTAFLCATLTSILLKEVFYDEINRPHFVFGYFHIPILYVEGVKHYIHNSFPSGHSTQAFAIFMSLVFTSRSATNKFIFFAIAVLTAYSRVHLSQHWLVDILAGSLIGFGYSVVFYFLFIREKVLPKLDVSLFSYKKR